MRGVSNRLWLLPALALLAGCGAGEFNKDRPEPGIRFQGKMQMGVAQDADGTMRTVMRITG